MSSFTYKWNLTDLEKVEKNGLKVFSTFACGGGSTMGYKMSGFDVIGCNEIDPGMLQIYKVNHSPKYSFLESIETFKLRNDLPKELFELDVLDGSPPCSSFSMAGSREKAWGKSKKFREGQVDQVLDDLFFHYIELARRFQPKVVIAENVKGMLQGNAKGYVKQIINLFGVAGYDVQLFLLNGATMGLPQARERVFFICRRKDLKWSDLRLGFNEKAIPLIVAFEGAPSDGVGLNTEMKKRWMAMKEGEGGGVLGKFNQFKKLSRFKPSFTLTANHQLLSHPTKPRYLNNYELKMISSFPIDYKFKSEKLAGYQMGMSVPPLMMHKISEQIYKQWFANPEGL
jgi:DNA (cytosine-5)-methyltransferase 1